MTIIKRLGRQAYLGWPERSGAALHSGKRRRGGGMNARTSTTHHSSVRPVGCVRHASRRLCDASILPCQNRDQNHRGSNKENDSQPQQDLRYKFVHHSPLGNLSFSNISERFQLKHLRAEVSVSAIYRAISLAIADHGPFFAVLGAAA
ncbi:hypothetical protein [Methylobacterium oryzae]|uniref:hypothetical protein n=1 Tax=Methylobacterium oryzae TaxID=334852 RepID=UPI002F351B9C